MPNLEDSILWLIPGLLLALFMVHAMMQFTMALLTRQRPPRNERVSEEQLRDRLFALNRTGRPFQLVETGDGALTVIWDVVDPSWYERFAKVKLNSVYRVRFFLDERRHEVLLYEHIRTANLFIGFDDLGLRPRFTFPLSFFAGPMDAIWTGRAFGILRGFPPRIGDTLDFRVDTTEAKHELLEICRRSGWTWRQVFWLPETTRWGFRLSQAFVPGPLRLWPARRFWGILYPLSYVLAIGYLMTVAGAWTLHNTIIVAGISAAWWGAWVLLSWALSRYSAPARLSRILDRTERLKRS